MKEVESLNGALASAREVHDSFTACSLEEKAAMQAEIEEMRNKATSQKSAHSTIVSTLEEQYTTAMKTNAENMTEIKSELASSEASYALALKEFEVAQTTAQESCR